MDATLGLVVLVLVCCLNSFSRADYQGNALFALKTSLNASADQLKDWNPNIVNPCTWSNVNCDPNNYVVTLSLPNMGFSGSLSPELGKLKTLKGLSLQGNGITGVIPKELGELVNLSNLDLERNNLTGPIPASLAHLLNLQFLILSHNSLSGTIPESLSALTNLTSLQLDSNHLRGAVPSKLFQLPKYNLTGNEELECGGACESKSKPEREREGKGGKWGPAAGAAAAVCALGAVGAWWWWWRRRGRGRGKEGEVYVDVAGEVERRIAFGQLRRFAWRELQVATEDFSEKNVLGQGGFGKVYKGVLGDETRVAVKRLSDHESPGGEAAFQREVEMISVAVHRNLLRLIGFCTTPTERLLVYPFMQNLSVAFRLRESRAPLEWARRKRVAVGTARGLEYLHDHCRPKIIHRDVKAANVLLDEDFEAVVGDFGLAKLVDDARRTNVTTQVRGTMGHIAPEYLSTGKSSERTDVFGYGILLLELVTGQRAIDFSRLEEEDEDVLLLDHVKKVQREGRIEAIVDPNLAAMGYDAADLRVLVQVALLCTQHSPEERPAMSEVVRMLEAQDGLAQRWDDWQTLELTRRHHHHHPQFHWPDHSIHHQDAIELSGGR